MPKGSYLRLEQNETLWTVEKLDAVARAIGTTMSAITADAEKRAANDRSDGGPWLAALGGE